MASRYWVGGTGTWDATNTINWSTTSGGVGGASVPTSDDTAIFDANSGLGTVTLSGSLYCDWAYFSGGPAINFSSSTLNVTNYCYLTSSSPINLNSSTINCSSFFSDNYNTSINKGTATIVCNNFYSSGLSFYNIYVSGKISYNWYTGNPSNYNLGTFNSLTVTGTNELIVEGNFTVDNLTIQGNSSYRKYICSNIPELKRNINVTSDGSVSLSYVDFEDIGAVGSAWTGTSLGDCGGNSNINFTTPVTRYAISGGYGAWDTTATWSTTSGGVGGASVPLPQDTAIFDSNSGVGTYNLSRVRLSSINSTGFSGTLNFMSSYKYVYGNLIVPSTTTVSVSTPTVMSVYLIARSSKNLTFTTPANILLTLDRTSANYTATGTIGSGNDNCKLQLKVNKGTFNASTNNLQLLNYSSLSGSTTNMGSGTWTLQGNTASTIWDAAGTLNKETSNIVINTGTNVSFYGGSKSYGKITISGRTQTYTVSFYGNNTISELEYTTGTGTHTINFQSGSTTNINKWSIRGSMGKYVFIGSTTTSAHTLNFTGSDFSTLSYLNISYSNATPTNTWYAGSTSINSGNNTGWIFADPQQFNLFFGSNF